MATITTIQSTDVIATSRTDLNTNFANLNSDKIETSYLDTDTSLAANSDTKIATQKATKAYVLANVNPTGASWNEYAADAGSTDAYAITLSGVAAYATGQTFKFKANTANTGAATLKVNSLAVITIKKDVSSDLATGDILANQIVTVIYDGTNMQLISRIPAPAINYKAGSATRDISAANSTQTIAHGLGVIPTTVRISGGVSGASGFSSTATVYFNSTQYSWYSYGDTGSGTVEASGQTFTMQGLDNASCSGVVTVDGTNISIAWTKSGSPTGTACMVWEVQY